MLAVATKWQQNGNKWQQMATCIKSFGHHLKK
jgi:hypothetical protein